MPIEERAGSPSMECASSLNNIAGPALVAEWSNVFHVPCRLRKGQGRLVWSVPVP